MSANKIKKEIAKRKKEGASEPKSRKPISFNTLQERFKEVAKRKNDLMKDRNEMIKKINENDKLLFECESQMRLLMELMNPKVPKKEIK